MVNTVGDTVTEAAGGGTDVVVATVDYTTPAEIELLVLRGTGLTGTGTANADAFRGDGGPNSFVGLGGDDVYVLGAGGDTVTEVAGGGTDSVFSSFSHTLGADVERLFLRGTGLTGTGNALGNLLSSEGGTNTLVGLGGDDTFLVGATADTVTEAAGEGFDTVIARVNFTLTANVEQLFLIGTGLSGTGTGAGDVLVSIGVGNTLTGLGGDDYYIVGAPNAIVEAAGAAGGFDVVVASTSFTLPANVKSLVLRGSALTGTGTSGADTLASKSGGNTLAGGDGNDSYIVGASTEIVTESAGAGAGFDTIYASASYTIAANVEVLVLVGSLLTATGSGLGDQLVSQGAGNTLLGGGGDDFLLGGAAADAMTGGAGGDAFAFRGLNGPLLAARFTIADFDASAGDGIDLTRTRSPAGSTTPSPSAP